MTPSVKWVISGGQKYHHRSKMSYFESCPRDLKFGIVVSCHDLTQNMTLFCQIFWSEGPYRITPTGFSLFFQNCLRKLKFGMVAPNHDLTRNMTLFCHFFGQGDPIGWHKNCHKKLKFGVVVTYTKYDLIFSFFIVYGASKARGPCFKSQVSPGSG